MMMIATFQLESNPHHPKRWLIFMFIVLVTCTTLLLLLLLVAKLVFQAQVLFNNARYDEVAHMIQDGVISGGSLNGDIVTLPETYRDLSPARNGQVLIYRNGSSLRILFYPFTFSPFSTQVYMYSSQEVSSMDFASECSEIKRKRPNWYQFHCP